VMFSGTNGRCGVIWPCLIGTMITLTLKLNFLPMGAQSSVLTFDDTQSQRVRNGFTALILYSVGHFFIDLYSSALGGFQPLLVERLHFTLTQAGLLGAVMTFSGSFVQPA